MHTPELIQCCRITNGNVTFVEMRTEQAQKNRNQSLVRIKEGIPCVGKTSILVGGSSIPVFLVAGVDFAFAEYGKILQKLYNNEILLHESILFTHGVNVVAGRPGHFFVEGFDAWFDFENDVFFTLCRDSRLSLLEYTQNLVTKATVSL